MPTKRLPWVLRGSDFSKQDWHVAPTAGFQLMFEFLRFPTDRPVLSAGYDYPLIAKRLYARSVLIRDKKAAIKKRMPPHSLRP